MIDCVIVLHSAHETSPIVKFINEKYFHLMRENFSLHWIWLCCRLYIYLTDFMYVLTCGFGKSFSLVTYVRILDIRHLCEDAIWVKNRNGKLKKNSWMQTRICLQTVACKLRWFRWGIRRQTLSVRYFFK